MLHGKIHKRCKDLGFTCSSPWYDTSCASLIESISILLAEKEKHYNIFRLQAWRQKLRDSFDLHKHGAAAFAWLHSKAPTPLQAVKNRQNQVVTSVGEMLDAISHAWQDLFTKDVLVNVKDIEHVIAPLLSHHHCELPPLTGADLKQKNRTPKRPEQ